jgi:hypothetical protein
LSAAEGAPEHAAYRIGMALGTDDKLNAYLDWLSKLRSAVSRDRQTANGNPPIDSASLEDSLLDWLEGKGFAEAWKLAPMLAEAHIEVSSLQTLERLVPADKLRVALSDIMAALEREASLLLVSEAADRIFRLVTAVKDYSYMDRQPVQNVNVAESLDTVLQLFQPRLAGITVKRFYSPDLPLLQAFGSELNQAWAALVENSLDAMGILARSPCPLSCKERRSLSRSPIPGTEFRRSMRIACSSHSSPQSPSARDWGLGWISCNGSSRSILARSLSIRSQRKQRFMCDCPWIALRFTEGLLLNSLLSPHPRIFFVTTATKPSS